MISRYPDGFGNTLLENHQRTFRSIRRLGFLSGIILALGWTGFAIARSPSVMVVAYDAVFVVMFMTTVALATVSARQGSWWSAGAIGISCAGGTFIASLTSFSTSVCMAVSLMLATLIRPETLGKTGWLLTEPVRRLIPSGTVSIWCSGVLLALVNAGHRQAISRGDARRIYRTADLVTVGAKVVGRTAEIPEFLSPLIQLAEETGKPWVMAQLAINSALGFAYRSDYIAGVQQLKRAYDLCAGQRDRFLALHRAQVRHAQPGQRVPIFDGRVLNYRSFCSSLANNLAVLWQEMGDLSQAEVWAHQAVLEVEELGKQHQLAGLWHIGVGRLVRPRLNYADILLDQDADPAQVTEQLSGAKRFMKGMDENTKSVWWLVEARRALRCGETTRGLVQSLTEAAEYFSAQRLLKLAAQSRLVLATVHAREGDLDACLSQLELASGIDDALIESVFPACADETKVAFVDSIRSRTDAYLSFVIQFHASSRSHQQKAFELVMRRKGLVASVQAERRNTILSGRYPMLERRLIRHSQLCEEIAGRSGSLEPDGQKRLRALIRERQLLEIEIGESIPEFQIAQISGGVVAKAVAKQLKQIGKNATLLEFFRFSPYSFTATHPTPSREPDRYAAFVVTTNEEESVTMSDLGDAETIDDTIRRFREAIESNTDDQAGRDLGAAPLLPLPVKTGDDVDCSVLRSLLFDSLIPSDCTLVMVAPDGVLSQLPFEVLIGSDGQRLIEDYRISYLSCGRDVLSFGNVMSEKGSPPLVIADPAFDLCSQQLAAQSTLTRLPNRYGQTLRNFKRLPGTLVEGKAIATLLGVDPWLESSALEGHLKNCSSPRILHIATHGFFLRDDSAVASENPLWRSGLVLAGVNTWLNGHEPPESAEDGILTAEDVAGLDLRHTQLVVLSACETGLGKIHAGEGVFGLRRAFVLAGAKTLVMSLWKVPDQATQELMEDFYCRILSGSNRCDALRDAQLAIKSKYPNPMFWGGFICQGDPSPMGLT